MLFGKSDDSLPFKCRGKNKPGTSIHLVSSFYKLNQESVFLSFSFIFFPSVVKIWLTRIDYTADENSPEKARWVVRGGGEQHI